MPVFCYFEGMKSQFSSSNVTKKSLLADSFKKEWSVMSGANSNKDNERRQVMLGSDAFSGSGFSFPGITKSSVASDDERHG